MPKLFEYIDLNDLSKFKTEYDKKVEADITTAKNEIEQSSNGAYASYMTVEQNATTGVVTFKLYSADNTLLDTKTLDLDTEHIIKSVSLDYANKLLVFTMADDSTIETDISDLIDGLKGEIQNVADDLADEISRAESAESDLGDRITAIENDYLTESDKTELAGDISAEETRAKGVENGLDTRVSDIEADYLKASDKTELNNAIQLRALTTETGNKIDLEIDSTNFKVVAKLYDKNNTLLSTSNEIDLPLESVVVSGRYDSLTKEVVLTLQSGSVIRFSVADLVSGLQTQIDSTHKLSSDLVDDAGNTNKFVTQSEKALITTNATDIANIKDGTDIDSFADVEEELAKKQNTIDVEHKLSANLIEENANKKFVSEDEKTTWNNKYDKPSGGIEDDLSDDVKASLSKADSAVQDSNYVHTDNNYTNADKQKLAGLSNYDDTVVRGLITAETSRATSQENKALYFKGAYDSEDGKIRQSWYVDLATLSWTWTNSTFWKATYLANVGGASDDSDVAEMVSANYVSNSINNVYGGASGIAFKKVTGEILCVNGSSTERPSGLLQYKLATSYTENIIENQSILPLDTNMANKIRQKVVDGLNLIDYNKRLTERGITNSGVIVPYANFYAIDNISCNPNTLYAHNLKNTNEPYVFFFNNNIFISSMVLRNSDTFTTPTNCNFIKFQISNAITNPMLNEGNHPYPYSDFNQKEHITNEQAELLKGEEEKSSNLFDGKVVRAGGFYNNNGVWNSNSIYTAYIVSLKAGKYTWTSGTETYAGIILTNSSGTYQSAIVSLQTRDANTPTTFTLSSDGYIVLSINNGAVSTTRINKGSQAQPYHEYCGEILHEMDLEPTLLWTNLNPNTSFRAQQIDVDMTNYKYIIVEYKRVSNSTFQETAIKKLGVAPYPGDPETPIGFCISEIGMDGTIIYRPVCFTSLTKLYILDCKYNGNTDNAGLIPIRIYGTNIP